MGLTDNQKSHYLRLNDIKSYKIAFDLSNYVWDLVGKMDYFAKDTIGKQFIKAVDSISANIAEGFGRYGKKDKRKFYRYSMGSQKESSDWNEKCKNRGLITTEQYNHIQITSMDLPKELNSLINFTTDKLKY